MLGLAQNFVEHIDFKYGRSLGLHHVGQIPAVGRPRGMLLRNRPRVGQVDHLPGLRRDHENVPLLIAVVIGLIGNPLPIRRPRRGRLPLIADRKLRRPSTRRRYQPQIIASAHVGDKHNRLPIRRPSRIADRARHVELFDRKGIRFDLCVRFAGDEFGIGDG